MNRERVIVDFDTFEQALKLEETVKSGYCDPIIENLLAWIAVEEDLSSSYEKLAKKFVDEKTKKVTESLSQESAKNALSLHEIVKSVENYSEAREKRKEIIRELNAHERSHV